MIFKKQSLKTNQFLKNEILIDIYRILKRTIYYKKGYLNTKNKYRSLVTFKYLD